MNTYEGTGADKGVLGWIDGWIDTYKLDGTSNAAISMISSIFLACRDD